MRSDLPPHLRSVLGLVVQGYTHEAIAAELGHALSTVHTYIRNLKAWFGNEPEMQDRRYSPVTALVVVGQRYFGQRRAAPDSASSGDTHQLEAAQQLVGALRSALHTQTHSDGYDYFASLHRWAAYAQVDRLQPRLDQCIHWLLQERQGLLRNLLLTELGALLPHYLNCHGQYGVRVRLGLAAAEAAHNLDRPLIEGWLRCDTLPLTLMEQFADPHAARQQLERGQQIARGLPHASMLGLSTALLARTYLLQGQIDQARSYISEALAQSYAPVVRARVYNVAGEVALAQRQWQPAAEFFTQARQVHPHDFGPRVNLGRAYLGLHEAERVVAQFSTLLEEIPAKWRLAHKTAIVQLELARALKLGGEISAARHYAQEAQRVAQPLCGYPQVRQFKREVRQFLARVEAQ